MLLRPALLQLLLPVLLVLRWLLHLLRCSCRGVHPTTGRTTPFHRHHEMLSLSKRLLLLHLLLHVVLWHGCCNHCFRFLPPGRSSPFRHHQLLLLLRLLQLLCASEKCCAVPH